MPIFNPLFQTDALKTRYSEIRQHHAEMAGARKNYIDSNKYFYSLIENILKFIISPNRSILHFGCQDGYLLNRLRSSHGVGVDISRDFVEIARRNYPEMVFLEEFVDDGQELGQFDYILVTNLSETIDLREQLFRMKSYAKRNTRFVFYKYNPLWQPLVTLAEKFGLKYPQPTRNWFTVGDVENIMRLSGYEAIKTYRTILIPKYVPVFSWIANRILQNIPLIRSLCFIEIIVARVIPERDLTNFGVSVIVPCRDEEGNVESVVNRLPELGSHTEIIFCDDQSTDGTVAEVRRMQNAHPNKDIKLVFGPGICKADNVWTGFDAATQDILVILDGDLTVAPEQLPEFVDVLTSGIGEFVNGSRMIYPMQNDAMRTLNIIGNRFFSYIFSFILGQRIKDTLCGTKMFWRADWPQIKEMVDAWGPKDRWGDFALIFGAAKLNLVIVDFPVHYHDRIAGVTKMTNRFRNAWNMAKMCAAAYKIFNTFKFSKSASLNS